MKISRIGIGVIFSMAVIFCYASCDRRRSGGNASKTSSEPETPSASKISEAPKEKAYQFHSTVTYLAEGTDGTCGTEARYCYFGDWPQTVKADSVTVNMAKSLTMGSATYYLGDDNNYYAKCTENAYTTGYKYSDGTDVAQISAGSEKYFKVEPIKWRVLNPGTSGNKILVAENILTANIPYYGSTDNRVQNTTTIYANNYKYSNIRSYLNGTANHFVLDGGSATANDIDWSGKGFLQTAFTTSAQSLIAESSVDNSDTSTSDASGSIDKAIAYACENTNDKIFLLSEKEVTRTDYGFSAFNESGQGNSRIRVATDYAKANHAYQSTTAGYGGWWWLRSPSYGSSGLVRTILNDGNATRNDGVRGRNGGIVPALSISAGN